VSEQKKIPVFKVNSGHACIFCSGTGKRQDSPFVDESLSKLKRCRACSGKGWFSKPNKIIVEVFSR
jgi:DnaJ-class molecular chaperone